MGSFFCKIPIFLQLVKLIIDGNKYLNLTWVQ